jgi:regulator of protease activity HflC (stomatin/prohibitin superfamily)
MVSRKNVVLSVLSAVTASSGCTCTTVDSGHRGIVFRSLSGGTSKELLGEGLHVLAPWNSVILFDTRVQELKEELNVISSNGLAMKVEASVRFRPAADELYELQTTVGPHFADKLLSPVVRSEARKVFGRYSPEEIYSTKREEIERQIHDEVVKALEGKHVVVEAVLVRDVVLPESIRSAIADKLAEEQRSQKMRFTLEKERQEADRKEIEAAGIAKYQSIVRQGLTEEYLQWKGIEATESLARSENAKIVIVGGGKSGLPVILQTEK